MTSSPSAGHRPVGGADWHADQDMLAAYAAGTSGEAAAWSIEAHLGKCPQCRSALSAHTDQARLARNRSIMLVRAATGDGNRAGRLLRRCGVGDHMLSLIAATPSLRRSWMLSILAVLAVVGGEGAAVRYRWIPAVGPGHLAAYPGREVLALFLLLGPLLVLAGVAAAFLPMFDPAYQLAVAAPFSGFTLLLVRSASALAAALIPVIAAAFVIPGPGWLPVALLLPSLALCALTLAATTVADPRVATVAAGALWALPVLWLTGAHVPLVIVQPEAQIVCAAVLCVSAAVVLARHDRFEWGWIK